jgi:hypothetical protein
VKRDHRTFGVVASALACGACFPDDTTPPELEWSSLDEAPQWLHDPLWFDFDDYIDFASWAANARIETADGTVLPARHLSSSDSSRVGIEVDPAAMAAGTLIVRLDGVLDTGENEPEVTTYEWVLDEWVVSDEGIEAGEAPGPPVIELMDDPWGEVTLMVTAVWTAGPTGARFLTGVFRAEGWQPAGEHLTYSAVELDGAACGDTLHVVAPEAYTWSRSWDDDFDIESADAIAAALGTAQLVVVRRSGAIEVELYRCWNDDPVVLPSITLDSFASHVDVALPEEDAPIVAFAETPLSDDLLRVKARIDDAWQEWEPRTVVGEVTELAIVAAERDAAFIAWIDEAGSHLASASRTGLADLAAPISSGLPQYVVDVDGALTAVWEEGGVGRIARLDGTQWVDVATPWDAQTAIESPRMTIWAGVVPAMAWHQDGQVRIALYNGPTP